MTECSCISCCREFENVDASLIQDISDLNINNKTRAIFIEITNNDEMKQFIDKHEHDHTKFHLFISKMLITKKNMDDLSRKNIIRIQFNKCIFDNDVYVYKSKGYKRNLLDFPQFMRLEEISFVNMLIDFIVWISNDHVGYIYKDCSFFGDINDPAFFIPSTTNSVVFDNCCGENTNFYVHEKMLTAGKIEFINNIRIDDDYKIVQKILKHVLRCDIGSLKITKRINPEDKNKKQIVVVLNNYDN